MLKIDLIDISWKQIVATFLNEIEPVAWPDYSLELYWILGDLMSTCSIPLNIGGTAVSKTFWMNRPVCVKVNNYLLAHRWQWFFSIIATPNMNLIATILHKIYSMKKINPHKKQSLVKYGQLHPEYAANLVASSKYYHCPGSYRNTVHTVGNF